MLKAFFFSASFLRNVALPIEDWTAGLITPATLAGSLELVVLVLGCMMIGGRLRSRDLGFRGGIARTVLGFGALWIVAHAVVVGGATVAGHGFHWVSVSAVSLAGSFLEAIVGSAVIEEVIYRGFLLVQVYLVMRMASRAKPATAFGIAVVLVQCYFAVSHVPAGMRMGLDPVTLALYVVEVGLVGVVLAMLFVRSGNIIVPIGAHALLNAPVLLVGGPVDVGLVVLVMLFTIIFVLLGEKNSYVGSIVPAVASPQT
jgi:membrane protease YdiL (CAAX protease family)